MMPQFTINELLEIYRKYQEQFGHEAYKHISQVLEEAKPLHKKAFTGIDHEQSWRAFKGKSLEKLIVHIITSQIEHLALAIIDGNKLEKTAETNLRETLSRVKRNLLIDYGELGCYLPDVDMVIYHPRSSKVIAVLLSKVTLRERIAQTAYWKLKLSAQTLTRHIKVYFITSDEDKALMKRGVIIEADLDGTYVLSENQNIATSEKVKPFEYLIDDLLILLNTQ